jgi:hypothetical protein
MRSDPGTAFASSRSSQTIRHGMQGALDAHLENGKPADHGANSLERARQQR